MDAALVIIGILIVLMIMLFIHQNSSGDDDEVAGNINSSDNTVSVILDESVSVEIVIHYLSQFKLKVRKDKNGGFSEKDVHDDLEIYLKNIFYSVTREHAIEGKNIKRIDFDIGNGKVGIELKLARNVLKEGENDRVIGQIQKYINRKYNSGNMILCVAGYNNHVRNTIIHELIEDVGRVGCHFVQLSAPQ